jgi:hypothetical protein
MTPLARSVMERVRQASPSTHEQWVQMIVDAALDAAAEQLDFIMLEIMGARSNAAVLVRSLKQDQEPCE